MSDLEITDAIRLTVQQTMKELGYDLKGTKDTISFSQGAKMIGRRTLENAMNAGYNKTEYIPGVVRWYKKDLSNPHCPVRVNRTDVLKIKNNNHC